MSRPRPAAASSSHHTASLKQTRTYSPGKQISPAKLRSVAKGSTFTVPIQIKDEQVDPELLSGDSEASPPQRPSRRKPPVDEDYHDDDSEQEDDDDEMAIGFEVSIHATSLRESTELISFL